jgi:hypothetical protein
MTQTPLLRDKILFRRSPVFTKRPQVFDIEDGELAINFNALEPGLFFRDLDDQGNRVIRKIGPIHVGDSAPNSDASTYGFNVALSEGEGWVDTFAGEGKYLLKVWKEGKWNVVGELYGIKDEYLDQFKNGEDGDNYVHTDRSRLKINNKTALQGLSTLDGNLLILNSDEEFGNGVEIEAEDFFISSGKTRHFRITSSGNVRIGDDLQPSERLDVFGNVKADGFIGPLLGNADTAIKLNSERIFSLSGQVIGQVSSDLAAGFTISAAIVPGSSPYQLLQTNITGTATEWASNIRVPGTLDVALNSTFGQNVTIQGNLIVGGTETIINTSTLTVEDKNIEIGKIETPTDVTAEGGGITLKGTTDKTLNWIGGTASWTSSESLDLVSNKTYKIAGTDVLGSTTLGSGVLFSSLTSVGVIGTGTWQGNAISDTYLQTIATAGKVSNSATTAISTNTPNTIVLRDGNGGFFAGTITAALEGNASTATKLSSQRTFTLSGDITGTVSSDLGAGFTISATIPTGTVTSAMIADGTIVNADVSATAAIAVSKLANGTARQLLQTNAAGTETEWTSNVAVPGTLQVTGVSTFLDKIVLGVAEPTAAKEVGWSEDEGAPQVALNGIKTTVGADTISLCRNVSASTSISKGTAVMFAGTVGTSGRLLVAPMVADGTMPGYVFFGIAANTIAPGADGYVKSFGKIRNVNTSAFAEGAILWCDPAVPGGLIATEPEAPNLKLAIAAVISSGNNGTLMVRWDTGRRLADLHDVESNGSTQDGEVLQYNASTARWEHRLNLELPGDLVLNGVNITESARDIEEARLIRRNGSLSIGVPGQVPFGVGPVIASGMAIAGLGPEAYNPVDLASGSFV